MKNTSRLDDAATALGGALTELPEGRLALGLPESLLAVTGALRDAARDLLTELKSDPKDAADGGRQAARAALNELHDVAERLAGGQAGPQGPDVAWVARIRRPDGGSRTALHVAPLSRRGPAAAAPVRRADRRADLCDPRAGRGFEAAAGRSGCWGSRRHAGGASTWAAPSTTPGRASSMSPGICRAPGRDGVSAAALDELAALVEAAGGRTLGLFSSRRAAEFAAAELRERLDLPVLCQGEDSTPTLVREFARDARTCLFGTLSLWQGVDVPGSACQLVVIDRIPFPRPDDPLASARQQAVARAGGNGFMAWPRRMPLCGSRKAWAAWSARRGIAAWSPSSTRGSRPPVTAASCGRPCLPSGRRTAGRPCSTRCAASTPRPPRRCPSRRRRRGRWKLPSERALVRPSCPTGPACPRRLLPCGPRLPQRGDARDCRCGRPARRCAGRWTTGSAA